MRVAAAPDVHRFRRLRSSVTRSTALVAGLGDKELRPYHKLAHGLPGVNLTNAGDKGDRKMAHSVIVGGSSGIGLVIAQRLADQGDEVVITSREAARADAVAREIGSRAQGSWLGPCTP